jgi:predicted kinase
MGILYIIRGVSGSGKTTLAQKMAIEKGCQYFEADMWFVRGDGEYIFDARELPRAHRWCQDQVRNEIANGRDVIVSNTFTREWEMQEYIRCASLHNYHTVVIECRGQYPNVHGLTEEAVAKQVARFESNDEIRARNSRYDDGHVTFLLND